MTLSFPWRRAPPVFKILLPAETPPSEVSSSVCLRSGQGIPVGGRQEKIMGATEAVPHNRERFMEAGDYVEFGGEVSWLWCPRMSRMSLGH